MTRAAFRARLIQLYRAGIITLAQYKRLDKMAVKA